MWKDRLKRRHRCAWCIGIGAVYAAYDALRRRHHFHKGCREKFRLWVSEGKP